MKTYEMTEKQLATLMDACKPVPYIVAGGTPPMSPQERANAAWRRLGDEMGFDFNTVKPDPGKCDRFFHAEESIKS